MGFLSQISPSFIFSKIMIVILPALLTVPVFIASASASCQHGQLLPDPSNCANYLQCNHDTEMVRPCPSGLLFNPSLSACDWPQNVECDGGVTLTSTSTSTSEPDPDVPVSGDTENELTPTTTTLRTTTGHNHIQPPPSQGQGHVHFAPYFDVNLNKGPSLLDIYEVTGQKDFTLAFALGSSEGCKPKWGGVTDINDPLIIEPVRKLQKLGGQFIVATGGAMGPYFEHLCQNTDDLARAYETVLDAVGTNHLDVDIESTVNPDLVNGALAKVQRSRPNTTVSYTLMVQAEDYGLTPILGVDILRNAKSNGVDVTIVNPMTMEFGGPSADFGDSVIGAATSVLGQMKQIWPEKSQEQLNRMLGVTPMIGRNFNGKIFRPEHARKLVDWAKKNQIGLLAFWSAGRDNGNCAGGAISPSCSSIQQQNFEFIQIFREFHKK